MAKPTQRPSIAVARSQSRLAALLNNLTHELLQAASAIENAEANLVLTSVPELPQLYEQILTRSRALAEEPHYILGGLKDAVSDTTTKALQGAPPFVSLRYVSSIILHLHNLYCCTHSTAVANYLESEETMHCLVVSIGVLKSITARHRNARPRTSAHPYKAS